MPRTHGQTGGDHGGRVSPHRPGSPTRGRRAAPEGQQRGCAQEGLAGWLPVTSKLCHTRGTQPRKSRSSSATTAWREADGQSASESTSQWQSAAPRGIPDSRQLVTLHSHNCATEHAHTQCELRPLTIDLMVGNLHMFTHVAINFQQRARLGSWALHRAL